MTKDRNWEDMGAKSGLLASVLFVISGVALLATSPSADPQLPDVQNARFAPAYFTAHLSQIRVVTLLTVLGIALFLWFLASLYTALTRSEVGGRGSTVALVGGITGSALILVGLMLTATAGLSTSTAQAEVVPTLYVASSLLVALGGGVLSLFFFGIAKVVFRTEVLPKWLGVVAFITGLIAVLTFFTPFFSAGAFNAATGVLGRWAWMVATVAWVFLASIVILARERREARAAATSALPGPAASEVPQS